MDNYKGIYFNSSNEIKYYEGGAHFKYSDLCKALNDIMRSLPQNESHSPEKNSFPQFNEVHSRNIKPFIQSLTQKLTEITKENAQKLNKDIIETIGSVNIITNTEFLTKENKRSHSSNIRIQKGNLNQRNNNIFLNKIIKGKKNYHHSNNNSNSIGTNGNLSGIAHGGKKGINVNQNKFTRNNQVSDLFRVGNNTKNESYNKTINKRKIAIANITSNNNKMMNLRKNFLKIPHNKSNNNQNVNKKKIFISHSKKKSNSSELNAKLLKTNLSNKNKQKIKINKSMNYNINVSHDKIFSSSKTKKNYDNHNSNNNNNFLKRSIQFELKPKLIRKRNPSMSLNFDNSQIRTYNNNISHSNQNDFFLQSKKNVIINTISNDMDMLNELNFSQSNQNDSKVNTQINNNNNNHIIFKPKINISFINNINQNLLKRKQSKSRNKEVSNEIGNSSLMKLNTSINQKIVNKIYQTSQCFNNRSINEVRNKKTIQKENSKKVIYKDNTKRVNNGKNKELKSNSKNKNKQYTISEHYLLFKNENRKTKLNFMKLSLDFEKIIRNNSKKDNVKRKMNK